MKYRIRSWESRTTDDGRIHKLFDLKYGHHDETDTVSSRPFDEIEPMSRGLSKPRTASSMLRNETASQRSGDREEEITIGLMFDEVESSCTEESATDSHCKTQLQSYAHYNLQRIDSSCSSILETEIPYKLESDITFSYHDNEDSEGETKWDNGIEDEDESNWNANATPKRHNRRRMKQRGRNTTEKQNSGHKEQKSSWSGKKMMKIRLQKQQKEMKKRLDSQRKKMKHMESLRKKALDRISKRGRNKKAEEDDNETESSQRQKNDNDSMEGRRKKVLNHISQRHRKKKKNVKSLTKQRKKKKDQHVEGPRRRRPWCSQSLRVDDMRDDEENNEETVFFDRITSDSQPFNDVPAKSPQRQVQKDEGRDEETPLSSIWSSGEPIIIELSNDNPEARHRLSENEIFTQCDGKRTVNKSLYSKSKFDEPSSNNARKNKSGGEFLSPLNLSFPMLHGTRMRSNHSEDEGSEAYEFFDVKDDGDHLFLCASSESPTDDVSFKMKFHHDNDDDDACNVLTEVGFEMVEQGVALIESFGSSDLGCNRSDSWKEDNKDWFEDPVPSDTLIDNEGSLFDDEEDSSLDTHSVTNHFKNASSLPTQNSGGSRATGGQKMVEIYPGSPALYSSPPSSSQENQKSFKNRARNVDHTPRTVASEDDHAYDSFNLAGTKISGFGKMLRTAPKKGFWKAMKKNLFSSWTSFSASEAEDRIDLVSRVSSLDDGNSNAESSVHGLNPLDSPSRNSPLDPPPINRVTFSESMGFPHLPQSVP